MKNRARRRVLTTVLAIASTLLFDESANAQNLRFVNGFTNQVPLGGSMQPRSVAVDASGNRYVTGWFFNTANFNNSGGSTSVSSNGQHDIYIAKYNPSGQAIYAVAMGSGMMDIGQAIGADAAGNVYVTGQFNGTVDFDPGPGVANLTSIDQDIFIAKYGPTGQYLWAFNIGGSSYDEGLGLEVDASGNVYVTGQFQQTADFDPGAGTATLTAQNQQEIFVAKYNSAGAYQFAFSVGGWGTDIGMALTLDASANIYVTGMFTGTLDFDPGPGTGNITSHSSDIFVAKYTSAGSFVFARPIVSYPSSTPFSRSQAIAVDGAGNITLAGSFRGSMDFDPGAGEVRFDSRGYDDGFIVRLNASGNFVAAKQIGGTESDDISGMALDAAGNVFIAGSYASPVLNFEPGVTLTSSGNYSSFFAKYDASLNYVSATQPTGTGQSFAADLAVTPAGNVLVHGRFRNQYTYGSSTLTFNSFFEENGYLLETDNNFGLVSLLQQGIWPSENLSEDGRSVVMDAAGNVYVAGLFSGAIDIDPGPGVTTLTPVGQTDIYFAAFNSSGSLLFARTIGSANTDFLNSLTLDAAGNIYLAGMVTGNVDFDPGPGTAIFNTAAQTGFVAKFDPSGNYIFAKTFAGSGSSNAYGVAVDASGNIIVVGDYMGEIDFDPNAGIANQTSIQYQDAFILKLDASGNLVFANSFGSAGAASESAGSVKVDATGAIYVMGRFSSTMDVDPGAGVTNVVSGPGFEHTYFAKYNADGSLAFANALTSTETVSGRSLAIDGAGNIYLGGSFGGTVEFNTGGTSQTLSSAMWSNNGFIAKYDASGTYVYARAIGSDGYHSVNGVATTATGNLYATGSFSGTFDFDPGAGVTNVTASGNDIFLVQYDASGNLVSAKNMGGPGSQEGGNAVAAGPDGAVAVTGYFGGTANFDIGSGNAAAVVTGVNGQDLFVAVYGPPTTLPVDFLSFNATPSANGSVVKVTWTTATETDNSHFIVERSTNGTQFRALGTRQGCTNCISIQTYSYNDMEPVTGVSYYRLKQVDIDGSFSYSEIRTVNINGGQLEAFVSPSVSKGELSVYIRKNAVERAATVNIVSASGSLVKKQDVRLRKGDGRIQLDLSNCAPGLYYVQITDGSFSQLLKFIKE